MNFFNKIPRITRNILILNIIMFFITPFLPESDFKMMLGYGPFSSDFNPIQPLTSMFLHGGFFHLAMNMLMIWMFGRTLEYEIGSQKYLILYLLSGLGGWLLHGLFYPDIPAIGASGALFGLIVSMAVFYPNQKVSILFLPFFSFKLKWMVMAYFAFEVISAFSGTCDGIAHLGHIGGAITGFFLTGFWLTNKFSTKLKSMTNG